MGEAKISCLAMLLAMEDILATIQRWRWKAAININISSGRRCTGFCMIRQVATFASCRQNKRGFQKSINLSDPYFLCSRPPPQPHYSVRAEELPRYSSSANNITLWTSMASLSIQRCVATGNPCTYYDGVRNLYPIILTDVPAVPRH
jgi:hypothetical protein